MEDKTYNVRISSRFSSESDWLTIDPVLLEGELVVIYSKSDIPNSLPVMRMKSGDGIHKYSELPYISADAADVYNWAKQKNKPTYYAYEIIGLEDYNNHTHNIEDIIGLQEALDKKSEHNGSPDMSPSKPDDSTSDSGGSSNDSATWNGQIIANNGLNTTQDGENVIIGINDNLIFILDGGDSSQFQS